MSIRRWLPWLVALAVVVVTAVVVLSVPNPLVCPGATRPVPYHVLSFRSVWICRGSHTNAPALLQPAIDHRVPLRVAIALGGVALAVAAGVALHRAYPTASRASVETRAGP